ncbi:MAG TPA: hypothetical protein VIY86_06205, partial [Pirellulaceae bacterium]
MTDASSWRLLPLVLALSALFRPYSGLIHDARLYAFQVLDHIEPGQHTQDLFLKFGSQDRFSLFSTIMVPLARVCGLEGSFFLAYLLSQLLFFHALIRFYRILRLPGWVLAMSCVYVAVMPLPYGGQATFHVHENFVTARPMACALCLYGLEMLMRRRNGLSLTLLLAAILVHPLMAIGGLAVWVGVTASRWLTTPWYVGLLGSTALCGGLFLAMPKLATGALGYLDPAWKSHVRAANPYCMPDLWTRDDHLAIAVAMAVVAGYIVAGKREGQANRISEPHAPTDQAGNGFPRRQEESRRFLAVMLVVALLGYLGSWLAVAAPYALLVQGQPYRSLWLLQVSFLPLAFLRVRNAWWQRGGTVVGAGLLLLWLATRSLTFTLWGAGISGFVWLLSGVPRRAWRP